LPQVLALSDITYIFSMEAIVVDSDLKGCHYFYLSKKGFTKVSG